MQPVLGLVPLVALAASRSSSAYPPGFGPLQDAGCQVRPEGADRYGTSRRTVRIRTVRKSGKRTGTRTGTDRRSWEPGRWRGPIGDFRKFEFEPPLRRGILPNKRKVPEVPRGKHLERKALRHQEESRRGGSRRGAGRRPERRTGRRTRISGRTGRTRIPGRRARRIPGRRPERRSSGRTRIPGRLKWELSRRRRW